jgi:hypothetical protein
MRRCSEVEVSRAEVLDWRGEELRSAEQEQADGAHRGVRKGHIEAKGNHGMGIHTALRGKNLAYCAGCWLFQGIAIVV